MSDLITNAHPAKRTELGSANAALRSGKRRRPATRSRCRAEPRGRESEGGWVATFALPAIFPTTTLWCRVLRWRGLPGVDFTAN